MARFTGQTDRNGVTLFTPGSQPDYTGEPVVDEHGTWSTDPWCCGTCNAVVPIEQANCWRCGTAG